MAEKERARVTEAQKSGAMVARRIGIVSTTAILGAAAAAAFQVVLARTFTAADFGRVAALIGLATILGPLFGLGLPGYLLAIAGRQGARWGGGGGAVVTYLAASGVVFAAAYLAATVLWEVSGLEYFVLLYGFGQASTEIEGAVAQVEGRTGGVAGAFLWPHLLRLLGIAPWLWSETTANATWVSIVVGSVACLQLLRGMNALRHLVRVRPPLSTPDHSLAQVARWAVPFGLTGLAFFLLVQGPLSSLELVANSREVAIVATCFTLLAATYIVPNVAFQRVLLVQLHSLWVSNEAETRAHFAASARWAVGAGVGAGLAVGLLAPIVIPTVFGDHLSRAGSLMAIAAVAVPVRFLSVCSGAYLTVVQRQAEKVVCLLISGSVGSALALSYGEQYGATGALWGYVVGECVLCMCYLFLLKKSGFSLQRVRH